MLCLQKFFEDEVYSPLKVVLERQLAKKLPNVFSSEILEFFGAKDPYKKDAMQQKHILQDLALLVGKNHFPIQFVEKNWLKCLVMHLCPRVVFLSKNVFTTSFYLFI